MRAGRLLLASPLALVACGLLGEFDFEGHRAETPPLSDAASRSDSSGGSDSSRPRDDAQTPGEEVPPNGIRADGAHRTWADGTLAASCDGYRHPTPEGGHAYAGSIGDGIYAVMPSGSSALDVFCDMTSDGGGWTLIFASSPAVRAAQPSAVAAQTASCTTPIGSCNVGARAWSYEVLRQTWPSCPAAEARIPRATFQSDVEACVNAADSLVVTWSGADPRQDGLKVWNGCAGLCGGNVRFAARLPSAATLPPAGPPAEPLWTHAEFVTSTAGLDLKLDTCESGGTTTVRTFHCPQGFDDLWIR